MQELSLNILDIAQNSVRAGADLIRILVDEQPADDTLTIVVEDNGCGMAPEQLEQVTDPFFTSRTTRKVGLGVPLFKMGAQMTGGSFQIESEPGKGTRVRAVFGYSHIDRMPLGDMCETMCSLVGCNPAIDFLYFHIYDGKSFCMDTREFRAVLGDVSLDTPDVIMFIRDYLRENIELLYGGASEDEKLS